MSFTSWKLHSAKMKNSTKNRRIITKYYEIWDVDANGDHGYARYDNESYFLIALGRLQDDPFIRNIKWRIIETGEDNK